jgi:glycogen operon protein
VARQADLLRFVRGLIRLRFLRESVRQDHRLTLAELTQHARVQLHGVHLHRPDHGHESRSLAVTASSLSGDLLMHFALNAWWEPLDFELPALPAWASSGWRRIIDTARAAPADLVEFARAERVEGATHRVAARTVVALFAASESFVDAPQFRLS